MCKFPKSMKPGEIVNANVTGGTCPRCGHCFETTVPAKYKGHKIEGGIKYHWFAYQEQRVCPACGTNLNGFKEPCNG